jgi:pimeloyl-ACP methyl ester carboxylesterase
MKSEKKREIMKIRTCRWSMWAGMMMGLAATAAGIDPTYREVAYGAHPRQVLDVYRAESTAPCPVVVYIHGGGFSSGSKDRIDQRTVRAFLDAGISVAAFNYRLIEHAPLPAAHQDCRYALQFLRARAGDWNIDKTRVGAFGGSAGAQICMYLAFHDDLADPDSTDPVKRESTRLTCVAAQGGQTTLDVEWWLANIPGYDRPHRDFYASAGVTNRADFLEKVKGVSALSLISADDPPIYMKYGMPPDAPVPAGREKRGWTVHHVRFGEALKAKTDALGIEADLAYPGSKTRYPNLVAFFKAHLLPPPD